MNNFKKTALILAMALSFTACVNNNQDAKKEETQAEMPAGDPNTDTSSENVNEKDPETVEENTGK